MKVVETPELSCADFDAITPLVRFGSIGVFGKFDLGSTNLLEKGCSR